MITRRTGAAATSGTGGASPTGGGGGGGGATGGAATTAVPEGVAGGRATTTPCGGGVLLAMAGRSVAGWPGRTTAPAGGRAPSGVRAAGCVTTGACRACGTMLRRGASAEASVRGCAMRNVGITGVACGLRGGRGVDGGGAAGRTTAASGRTGGATATGAAGTGAGGATTGAAGATEGAGAGACDAVATTGFAAGVVTTGFRPGAATTAGLGALASFGLALAALCSAWRRSRMARAMSPGFEAREKSTFCLTSALAADALATVLRPPVRWPRTLSASSSSIDELCVFFSVTPTAVSASRICLLLTSSSRARSLILTLLNPPSSQISALNCS